MDSENICYLIGAGDLGFPKGFGLPGKPREGDTVICADAGYLKLGSLGEGWSADHIIGDLDSMEEGKAGAAEALQAEFAGDRAGLDTEGTILDTEKRLQILPAEKNVTDLQAAWNLGKALGYRHFLMTGCFGGRRFDHSLGNLHLLLAMAGDGGEVLACSEDLLILPLLAGQTFDSRKERLLSHLTQKDRYLSLVPAAGDARGVTIRGLKYELEKGILPVGSTLGISNEIRKGADFSVSAEEGSLWIVISEKDG